MTKQEIVKKIILKECFKFLPQLEPLFEEQRRKATALQADIQRTDREIDGLVYGLYGLGEEEVRIVEGG